MYETPITASTKTHSEYLIEHEKRISELEKSLNDAYEKLGRLESVVGIQVPGVLHG